MKDYLKLVNFEINRFAKIYLSLIIITIISQLFGVYHVSKKYLDRAYEHMYMQGMTAEQYTRDWGKFSYLDISQSVWVIGSIAICIVAMLFYIFLIWYRDWFGKNTFIYRLLMLPTNRLNIYFAKATTIFIMTLGLVALQIVLLLISKQMLIWLVPDVFRHDLSLVELAASFNYLMILFPPSLINFIIHYGLGLTFVIIIFTAILFERSFQWRGFIMGVIYSVAALVILLLPIFLTAFFERLFLYPHEYFLLEVVLVVVVVTVSIWVSHYLLRKKITV